MHRRQVVAAVMAVPLLLALPAAGSATESYRVSAPVIHDNLTIFFVHAPNRPGPVPLTLEEALAKGVVKVHETGNVNALAIENLGDLEVFVNSGEIVKGGQQDRALTVSMMLPPKSGRIAIDAFCVEQGRWSKRGVEDVRTFATASALLPSRDAKIAMKAARPVATAGSALNYASEPNRADVSSRQQEMWRAVGATQNKIADRVGVPIAAPQSETSLQLSLENEKLKTAQEAYIKALKAAGEQDSDIVGYVFAINGKINSAEIYPSNGLFRKLWGKLLSASVTEAIGERTSAAATPATVETVNAFLAANERGAVSEKKLPINERLVTRGDDSVLYFETRRADGSWLHRSYLAAK